MRGRKREPGTYRWRMRQIFQESLEIVFYPYISVDGDVAGYPCRRLDSAMKCRVSIYCVCTCVYTKYDGGVLL